MKALKWLEKNAEEVVLCILLIIMSCVMFLQVIARFVFSNSLAWSEELTRYLFVWSTFIGISYCIRKRLTIQIEIVVDALPDKARTALLILVDLVQIVMFAYLVSPAFTYLQRTIENGQTSAAMLLPMEYVYAAPFIGFILAVIRPIDFSVPEIVSYCVYRRGNGLAESLLR